MDFENRNAQLSLAIWDTDHRSQWQIKWHKVVGSDEGPEGVFYFV